MDFRRLFHVLVIGGSVLGCESARSSALSRSEPDDATVAEQDGDTRGDDTDSATNPGADTGADADASTGGTGATDAGPGDTAAPGMCLCSPTHCCDQHNEGPATVSAG